MKKSITKSFLREFSKTALLIPAIATATTVMAGRAGAKEGKAEGAVSKQRLVELDRFRSDQNVRK